MTLLALLALPAHIEMVLAWTWDIWQVTCDKETSREVSTVCEGASLPGLHRLSTTPA